MLTQSNYDYQSAFIYFIINCELRKAKVKERIICNLNDKFYKIYFSQTKANLNL